MTRSKPPSQAQLPLSAQRAKSLWASFGYAFQGLAYLLRTQRNFRIHSAIAACVLAACGWLQAAPWEWVAVILLVGLVLITEALNTAIETLTDLTVGETLHPWAKIAKDVAAAACLIAAITSVVVGLLIFVPKV